jgi:hypothetical protein
VGVVSALTSLDGLAVGADVGIVRDDKTEHWVLTEGGGLTRNGKVLDRWFLSGLLANGQIVDGNFAPASSGDWFRRERRLLLVVEVKGTVATVATFTGSQFIKFDEWADLAENATRVSAPSWSDSDGVLLAMTRLAWASDQLNSQLSQQVRNLNRVRNYLSLIKQYVDNAAELVA